MSHKVRTFYCQDVTDDSGRPLRKFLSRQQRSALNFLDAYFGHPVTLGDFDVFYWLDEALNGPMGHIVGMAITVYAWEL